MKVAILKARAIRNEIGNCMYDLAGSGGEEFEDYSDQDAEADRLYNDIDTMRDLVGDRIFWACSSLKTPEDKEMALKVSQELINIGHPALKEAVKGFVKDHKL